MADVALTGSVGNSAWMSASSFSTGFAPAMAFDGATIVTGDDVNAWVTDAGGEPAGDDSCWIQFNFPTPKAITGIRFTRRGYDGSDHHNFPKTVKIFISSDANFITEDISVLDLSLPDVNAGTSTVLYEIPYSIERQYLRIEIWDNWFGGAAVDGVALQEIELLESPAYEIPTLYPTTTEWAGYETQWDTLLSAKPLLAHWKFNEALSPFIDNISAENASSSAGIVFDQKGSFPGAEAIKASTLCDLTVLNNQAGGHSFESLGEAGDTFAIAGWVICEQNDATDSDWFPGTTFFSLRQRVGSGTHAPFALGISVGKLACGFTSDAAAGADVVVADELLDINNSAWHFVGFKRSGTSAILFVDDQHQTFTISDVDCSVRSIASDMYFGAGSDDSGTRHSFFVGGLSEFLVFQGQVSTYDLKKLFTFSTVPPTHLKGLLWNNPTHHWNCNDLASSGVLDDQIGTTILSASGSPEFEKDPLLIESTASIYADGRNGHYFKAATGTPLITDGDAFSIEMWTKLTGYGVSYYAFMLTIEATDSRPISLALDAYTATNVLPHYSGGLVCYLSNGNKTVYLHKPEDVNDLYTIAQASEIAHILVTFDGVDDTDPNSFQVYINGVKYSGSEIISVTDGGFGLPNQTAIFPDYIGEMGSGYADYITVYPEVVPEEYALLHYDWGINGIPSPIDETFSGLILQNDPLVFLQLDEFSGATEFVDFSGNRNHATILDPLTAIGFRESGLHETSNASIQFIAGSSTAATLPTKTKLSTFSIELWISPGILTIDQALLVDSSVGGLWLTNNLPNFKYSSSSHLSSQGLILDKIAHIVVTCAAGVGKMFVNGTQTANFSSVPAMWFDSIAFDGTSNYSSSKLDGLVVYPIALNQEKIQNHFVRGSLDNKLITEIPFPDFALSGAGPLFGFEAEIPFFDPIQFTGTRDNRRVLFNLPALETQFEASVKDALAVTLPLPGFYADGFQERQLTINLPAFAGVFEGIRTIVHNGDLGQSYIDFGVTEESDYIYNLLDSLGLGSAIENDAIFTVLLESNLSLSDIFNIGFSVELTSSLLMTDNLDQAAIWVRNLISALGLSSEEVSSSIILQTLISGIVFGDLIRSGRVLNLESQLDMLSNAEAYFKTMVQSLSEMTLGASQTNSLVLLGTLESALDFSDEVSVAAIFQAALESNLIFAMTITLGDETYSAWVLNPATSDFTEYSNFNFNSYVSFGGESYGFNESGIFLLEGDDDNGTEISAKIRSGLIDFGVSNLKNVREAFFGISTEGEILVKTISTKKGQKRVDYYKLRPETGGDSFGAEQTFSKAVWSRYWEFEIENLDGSRFELDEIEWRTVILRRKV